jgi:hypothetical protein
MSETASQAIIKRSMTPETVTDARGRKIDVLRVEGAPLSRILMMMGDGSSSQLWVGATLARAAVRAIDAMPIPFPTSLAQLHGLWESVDADAASAASDYLNEKALAETPAAAKNSSAPQASDSAAT